MTDTKDLRIPSLGALLNQTVRLVPFWNQRFLRTIVCTSNRQKQENTVSMPLVRDIGGHLVTVIHNVNVSNIVPIIEIRFDGFLVENGSTITVPSSGNWTFSANTTFDTSNDQDTSRIHVVR